MKILNLEPYGFSDAAKKLLIENGWEYLEGTWSDFSAIESAKVDALIIRLSKNVGRDELKKFPRLKYLLSATTGLDHIDQEYLVDRGIRLFSLRGEHQFLATIPSTAEHTWALLLSLVRNVPSSFEDIKRENWNRDKFRGRQLAGKKIGIVGLGRVGTMVAYYAEAFHMEVCYFDPFIDNSRYKRYKSLNGLLSVCDIITIHVHLTSDTINLLNNENLSNIKKGVFIINTSRGGIIDESALVQGLKVGLIAGVAVDVLNGELEAIQDSYLWKAAKEGENVIITPHIGGASWDAMHACEEFLCQKFINMV